MVWAIPKSPYTNKGSAARPDSEVAIICSVLSTPNVVPKVSTAGFQPIFGQPEMQNNDASSKV